MSSFSAQQTPRHRSPPRPYSSGRPTSGRRDELNASAIPLDAELQTLDAAPEISTGAASAANLYPAGALRGSDLRSMLLTTEREVADLREECSVRATELETLKAALQREHEANLRAQTRHQSDLDEMREEYERQQSRLIEQITVLKGVSEAALTDKTRAMEEAQARKQQLLQLLEREREEKSQLMADYRQQTETLIAEQGREITGLRNLLEASRNEEEKLVAAIRNHEERRSELEAELLSLETSLGEERVANQKRLREQDTKLTQQVDQLRAKLDEDAQLHRQELLKVHGQREALEDSYRSLSERFRLAETSYETDRRSLKESYDADVASLQEEIKVLKDQREKSDAAHKRELERISKGDESLMQSLRKTVDTLRSEKQQSMEEARAAREALVAENNSKMQQLHIQLEALRREVTEERTQRKDAEAARQSLSIRSESMQSQINRLTSELENAQVESRTRERAVEQEHNQVTDQLRNQIRSNESDLASLKQQLKKAGLEAQRLSDESDAKTSQLDTLRLESQRTIDHWKSQHEQLSTQFEQAKLQYSRTTDVLQGQKVQLEAESGRLQRNVAEMESRYNASVKQLQDERRALEVAMLEIQTLKSTCGDTKQLLETERMQSQELEEQLDEQRRLVQQLRHAIDAIENQLRDSRAQSDALRDEMGQMVRGFEEKESDIRQKHRNAVESLENQVVALRDELRGARETQFTLETETRHLRDEASRWQRECAAKEEEFNDTVRSLRQQEDDETRRMDALINGLREDLGRNQAAKAHAQREVLETQRDADRRVAIVQEALEAERSSKHRLHDEIRNKEQVSAELQGTVRLLTTRLQSKEDDLRRLESELTSTSERVHEAHSIIGKKDAIIGQLNARLRVFESRGTL